MRKIKEVCQPMWLVSHRELSQTRPLCAFLLLFGAVPATPCWADAFRAVIGTAIVFCSHYKTCQNAACVFNKHKRGNNSPGSQASLRFLWNFVLLSTKSMGRQEPLNLNSEPRLATPGLSRHLKLIPVHCSATRSWKSNSDKQARSLTNTSVSRDHIQ